MLGTWINYWSPTRKLQLHWTASDPTCHQEKESRSTGVVFPSVLPLLTSDSSQILLYPQLWMPVLINNQNINPIHKKNWYDLLFWARMTSWLGSSYICLDHPLISSLFYSSLDANLARKTMWAMGLHKLHLQDLPSSSWRQAQVKEMENPLRTRWPPIPFWPPWGPPSSTATPSLACLEVPASRLLGQLAASVQGTEIDRQQIWEPGLQMPMTATRYQLAANLLHWKEWQTDIIQWVAHILPYIL